MIAVIEKLMKEKGVKAIQFVTEAGLPKSAISEWKNNRYKPSLDATVKIADYFGVSVDYLLGRMESKELVTAPGKKKEPHLRLARLGGIMVMNKEARECLEKLEVMFRATLDNPLSFINVQSDRGNKGSYVDTYYKDGKKLGTGSRVTNLVKSVNDIRKELEEVHNSPGQQDERLKEIGVTRAILKEWLDFNFASNPPTAEQLHKIYDNYTLMKRTGGDSHLESLRRFINKYIAAMAEQDRHDQIEKLTKDVESLRDMNIDKANSSTENGIASTS